MCQMGKPFAINRHTTANRKAIKVPKMKKIGNAWKPTEDCIGGIPLCERYKYLGTWMDSKLTCGAQIYHIKKKAAHIFVKLYSYLAVASADARRDMWQTMVSPLFNSAYVLLQYEPSEANRASLERLQRMTFKKFLMISKSTNSILVLDMMRKDLRKLSYATVTTCKLQWEQRKAFQSITATLPCLALNNSLRGFQMIGVS